MLKNALKILKGKNSWCFTELVSLTRSLTSGPASCCASRITFVLMSSTSCAFWWIFHECYFSMLWSSFLWTNHGKKYYCSLSVAVNCKLLQDQKTRGKEVEQSLLHEVQTCRPTNLKPKRKGCKRHEIWRVVTNGLRTMDASSSSIYTSIVISNGDFYEKQMYKVQTMQAV